jgi:hypothetical protein
VLQQHAGSPHGIRRELRAGAVHSIAYSRARATGMRHAACGMRYAQRHPQDSASSPGGDPRVLPDTIHAACHTQ